MAFIRRRYNFGSIVCRKLHEQLTGYRYKFEPTASSYLLATSSSKLARVFSGLPTVPVLLAT